MKKSKLLLLSTIAPISLVLPIVATSCNNGEDESVEFVCEQTEQTTTRGDIACWYRFDLQGDKTLSQDLEVIFNSDVTGKLSDKVILQPVEGSNKSILVGVEGIKDNLSDNEEVLFKLKLKSSDLNVDQSFDCKYTFLESKVSARTPKNNEVDYSITTKISVKLDFDVINDTTWQENDVKVELMNLNKSSSNIQDPGEIEWHRETTGKILEFGFALTKTEDFSQGDWVTFDVKITNNKQQWEQILTGYSYTVKEITYLADEPLNTKTTVQVDYKGTQQEALKAVDDSSKGILKKGTPIGSAFKLTYLKKDTPWSGEHSYLKFTAYTSPEETFTGYHDFWSVAVSIIKADDSIESLYETTPGDYFGEIGYWWISEGGPITIVNRNGILDHNYEGWKGLIFSLRTADEIKTDTSFYITYSNR